MNLRFLLPHKRLVVPHLLFLFGIATTGCLPSSPQEIVVYAALDEEFSQPALDQFQQETGIVVLGKYDTESTKTVGLVEKIIAERNRPACDVFWNNEVLHTLRLEKQGLLEAYLSPHADPFPKTFRSPKGYWYGLAARARILIVNTDLVAEQDMPSSVMDLIDSKWQGQVGIAKPLFGTTATHAAVLFAHWGDQRAQQFFRDLSANAKVLSGNRQVAQEVAAGQLAFGLTDTDDAMIEVDQHSPVKIIFPDQGQDEMGALFVPNTICIIKNGPHPKHARQLVDYLLTPPVEAALAECQSAQFPLNPDVKTHSRAMPSQPLKWMDTDFRKAADKWETARQFVRELLATGE